MLLVSSANVGEPERSAVSAIIDSGWLTMGERVQSFEKAFAAVHGVEDCVAVSSCTAALHLILHALDIGPGDEVLVPSLTFVATVNSILYVGARPVFVDIESAENPLISIKKSEPLCTSRTKAIILVHFAGYIPDPAPWQDLANRKGLYLISDAAHAPGVRELGTFGDAAAFSFYGNKNMTTAEGGAVIASDPAVLQKVRQARAHGMSSGTHQRLNSRSPNYDVTILGFNYRLDEIRAAIGLVQLSNLLRWNEVRRNLASHYRSLLESRCPKVTVPFSRARTSAHHILPVLLPDNVDRQDVIDDLRANEIQTTIHYPPVHTLTFYRSRYPNVALPQTEAFAARELTLPLHPLMSYASVEHVVGALANSIRMRCVS
jgi:dTDP-4-amino-4,6-dideoxygalactose transaminase